MRPASRLRLRRFKPWRRLWDGRGLSLRAKIGLGYAAALGLAVIGIEAGTIVGGYYYQQALVERQDTLEELETIRDVQAGLIQLEVSRQRLLRLIHDPYAFRQEYDRFVTNLGVTVIHGEDLKDSYEADTDATETEQELALLIGLVGRYDTVLNDYHQRVERTNRIQALEPTLLTPASAQTLTEGILAGRQYVAPLGVGG